MRCLASMLLRSNSSDEIDRDTVGMLQRCSDSQGCERSCIILSEIAHELDSCEVNAFSTFAAAVKRYKLFALAVFAAVASNIVSEFREVSSKTLTEDSALYRLRVLTESIQMIRAWCNGGDSARSRNEDEDADMEHSESLVSRGLSRSSITMLDICGIDDLPDFNSLFQSLTRTGPSSAASRAGPHGPIARLICENVFPLLGHLVSCCEAAKADSTRSASVAHPLILQCCAEYGGVLTCLLKMVPQDADLAPSIRAACCDLSLMCILASVRCWDIMTRLPILETARGMLTRLSRRTEQPIIRCFRSSDISLWRKAALSVEGLWSRRVVNRCSGGGKCVIEDVSGTASPLLACFAELYCTICEHHGVTIANAQKLCNV
jgi:hypothetical protein